MNPLIVHTVNEATNPLLLQELLDNTYKMNNLLKSKQINEQIEHALDTIDPEKTIELKLKDFMLMYKSIEEFRRFFHQPLHYPTLEDVTIYLGNKECGAYSIMNQLYCKILDSYLPKAQEAISEADQASFTPPSLPYYLSEKKDKLIDDNTSQINDRQSFAEYLQQLKEEYTNVGQNWENRELSDFLEALVRYSEDIDGYYKNMGFETSANTPTWRVFAQIIKGAFHYE